MFREAGLNDLRIILITEKGLRAATRWMIRCGLLEQFLLAREQLYQTIRLNVKAEAIR